MADGNILRDRVGKTRKAQPSKKAATPAQPFPQRMTKRPGTSLNHQIFLVLRDRIRNGQYEAGKMLPSEGELAKLFTVSRVTIRAAMASLEEAALIERRQGVGTFVTLDIPSSQLHAPVSDLIAHIADINRKTNIRLLEFDYVKAPLHIQSKFNCGADTVFQRAVRLRSLQHAPVFYVTTFLPHAIAETLTQKELGGTSLYHLLAGVGIHLHSGTQVVSAQLADPIVAPLLNVAVGAPLIQIRRLHFDKAREPIEYIEMLASPTMFELHVSMDAESLLR